MNKIDFELVDTSNVIPFVVQRDQEIVDLYECLRKSPASRGAQSPVGQSSRTGARKRDTFFDSGWIGVALMMLTAMLIGCWFAVGHS